MHLSYEVAQRIVDRVSAGLEEDVSVVDRSARILASTNPALIGTSPELAARALVARAPIEAGDSGKGVGVPLIYVDDIVGALVLHGLAQNRVDVARVSQAFAE